MFRDSLSVPSSRIKHLKLLFLGCLTLKIKTLPSIETSQTTHPLTELSYPEDLNLGENGCVTSFPYKLSVAFVLDYLTLEDGTDRFSRKVGDYHSVLRKIPEE
jgi:hypothetical protein